MDVKSVNKLLAGKSPLDIVQWAIDIAKNPVVTTNFRPYESAILHLVTQVDSRIKVVWCDTGYNTPDTYRHAKDLIDKLNLNIEIFVPKQSAGFRDVILGVPQIDDPEHVVFTEQVKLEPFRRAMQKLKPDFWFTNLRKGQTAFRDSIDIVSLSKDGVVKVSPFYHWTDKELDEYLNENNLPNEFNYYDPTKQLANRECGLHN